MKERLLIVVLLSIAPFFASAIQITSWNVWADGRTIVTDNPKDDLAGPRNEWTIVLPQRHAISGQASVNAGSINLISALPGTTDSGFVDLSATAISHGSENNSSHFGRKQADPQALVPDTSDTGKLCAVVLIGLVFLKNWHARRPFSQTL